MDGFKNSTPNKNNRYQPPKGPLIQDFLPNKPSKKLNAVKPQRINTERPKPYDTNLKSKQSLNVRPTATNDYKVTNHNINNDINNEKQSITSKQLSNKPIQPPRLSKQKANAKSTGKSNKLQKVLTSNIVITLLAIIIGLAFYDAKIGQYIIIVFGLLALILRLDSRYIFGAAIFMLVMIPALSILGKETLSENYAIYCFLLLVFGTLRSLFELKSKEN